VIVCPHCSEEHPVTLDRCPITGKPLREPAPVERVTVPQERTPFGALLAEAAGLYRRNLLAFLVAASIAFVPVAALQLWSFVRFAPTGSMNRSMLVMRAAQERRPLSAEEQEQLRREREAARPGPRDLRLQFALLFLLLPLFIASQTLAHAALVPLVADRSFGGNMGPARAWLAVGMRAGPILWTAALSTAATMVGSLLCVVPGILAYVGLALTMPVVLLERRRGVDALQRSWHLMRVEWPRVVGLWLVAVLAMFLVGSILSPALLHWLADPADAVQLMSRWAAIVYGVQILVSMLLFPLPIIGTTLVYLHARREQENLPLSELQLQLTRAASGW
jgi:hypothetical protein